jgi:hypothetical protein
MAINPDHESVIEIARFVILTMFLTCKSSTDHLVFVNQSGFWESVVWLTAYVESYDVHEPFFHESWHL